MSKISAAAAYANNEVALIAWKLKARIPECLGFDIHRQYLGKGDAVTSDVPLAAYVAFEGQSNPEWKPQNTGVWPIQKFFWRDLTLRKRRDKAARRPDEVKVRYLIRPVGRWRQGLEEVKPRQEKTGGKPNTYEGEPIRLGYLDEGVTTNAITITRHRPPFETTFTNGILSGQWLTRALTADDGKITDGELVGHLKKPGDDLRSYLSGDVLPLMRDFFGQKGGRFHLALYELEDDELEALITANARRVSLILANTGQQEDEDGEAGAKVWDGRNAPARRRLVALAEQTKGFALQHRLFNNSVQIGHNKFIVWVDDRGRARSVLTGSTNWTWSGLTGQTNNCIRIDMPEIAERYLDQWRKLEEDAQPLPAQFGDGMPRNQQGKPLRAANQEPQAPVSLKQGKAETWFSPNMIPRRYPTDPATPPDLDRVFSLMRQAREAIFFLAFYPSMQGRNSIVEQAVNLGHNDSSLLVVGAVSSAQAMFNFKPRSKTPDGHELPADAPYVYRRNRVSVVRASALTERMLRTPLGNFSAEILKVGQAVIHDKILVIDPRDAKNCAVVFGSHNFGFKASYSNDENLVIVRGHQALAEAYGVHVLDVYDHYRFRAAESELKADGKKGWDGFLSLQDDWQDRASSDISRYFAG